MTLVAASERDPKLEMQQAELMASRKISGLLVVTSTTGDDQGLQQLKRTGLAIVAFDRPLSGMQTDAVVVENRYGAEEAVRHLIKHGHKRIACAGYDEKTFAVRERIEGYTSCMNAAGLKPEVVLGVETQERTRAWLEKAMIQKGHPTAIFALNHRVSTFLLTALAAMKIAIPEKVALIGFDDFDLASIVSPPLTTITQSPTQLSKRAMALLIERIEDQSQKRESMPAKVVLPVSLTIRASCGCTPDKQV
jgi:LacI family transcriptional regulator